MKELKLEIKPLEGFGEIEFGATPDEVFEYLGPPDEEEVFEDDDEISTKVFHFWDKAVSAFFEDPDDPVLINIETDNPDATLFGKHIFAMKEKEVIQLMLDNGYKDIDSELMESDEFDNEKRVSFDDGMIDFFFEEEILTAVTWGVFLADDDEEDEQ